MTLSQPTAPVKPTGLAGILAVIGTDMIARGFEVSVSPTSVTISSGDRAFRLAATDLDVSPIDGVPGSPIADLLMRMRTRVPPLSGAAPAEDAADARRLDERLEGLDIEFPRLKDAVDRARDRAEVTEWYARYSEG